LDANVKSKERISLLCTADEVGTFTVGSLRLGGTEQFSTDLIFDAGIEISFSVVGPGSVHLFGYFLGGEDFGDDSGEDDLSYLGMSDEEGEEGNDDEDDEEEEAVIMPPPATTENGKKKRKNEEPVTPAQTPNKKSKQPSAQKAVVNTPKAETPKPETPKPEGSSETPKSLSKKEKRRLAKEKKEEEGTPNSKTEKSPQTPSQAKEHPVTPRPGSTPLKEPSVKKLPNGLQIEDIVIGSGTTAAPGKKVGVKYIGKLENGKVFDSPSRDLSVSVWVLEMLLRVGIWV
jgi:FK506-binding nuclear protein